MKAPVLAHWVVLAGQPFSVHAVSAVETTPERNIFEPTQEVSLWLATRCGENPPAVAMVLTFHQLRHEASRNGHCASFSILDLEVVAISFATIGRATLP